MSKLSSKSMDLGKVVATVTVISAFGESSYNVYEKSAMTWEEGVKHEYVDQQRVTVITKAVN